MDIEMFGQIPEAWDLIMEASEPDVLTAEISTEIWMAHTEQGWDLKPMPHEVDVRCPGPMHCEFWQLCETNA